MFGAMTFQEYIISRRPAYTPQGFFVRSVLMEISFPEVGSWLQLEAYLRQRDYSQSIILTARSVWESYRKSDAAKAQGVSKQMNADSRFAHVSS
ncbi:MAG: hypothetical protein EOP50_17255 [Sphingobacteriales bacterium]|nr:MAG: hypothetical protein EOP50_17255 [Sphingobacteriales bacterium]